MSDGRAVNESSKRRLVSVIFDGTFEGFLCTLNAYYHGNIFPDALLMESEYQQSIGANYFNVTTDFALAKKISEAIADKISEDALYTAINAFQNSEAEKYLDIYRYLITGFKVGASVDGYNHLDYIRRVKKLASLSSREAMHLRQFLRFIETADGTLYAEITPMQDSLVLLLDHFRDRFKYQRWIIHDTTHGKAAIYDSKQCIIVPAPNRPIFENSEQETYVQKLWQMFHKTVAVEQRLNKKLQRQHLPMKYRKNMTEFALDIPVVKKIGKRR